MPAVIRRNVDKSTGHCYHPEEPTSGSPNVWVNDGQGGDQAVRAAPNECAETQPGGCGTHDSYPSHTCGNSTHPMGCAKDGSDDVFVNCQPFHRNGDKIDCGDVANNGSPNVFANSETGESYMVDNTVSHEKFIFPDSNFVLPEGNQPTTTPFEFHVVTHDDEESSTEDPSLPPLTSPGSFVVPDPVEEDQTPPPATQPPVYTCANIESLDPSFQWQDVCHKDPGYGTGPLAGSPPAPTCLPNELLTYYDTVFAPSFQLSPNFTLADLTINPAVSTYRLYDNVGLTQKEILQNLCFLVGTVLDPMVAMYGSFLITSGFRFKSGGSQHNKGQAVDIQFPGFSAQDYWDMALDIKDNINFDQFILEYGGINPWLHISVNPVGHRRNVLTQTAPNTYRPGLIRMV